MDTVPGSRHGAHSAQSPFHFCLFQRWKCVCASVCEGREGSAIIALAHTLLPPALTALTHSSLLYSHCHTTERLTGLSSVRNRTVGAGSAVFFLLSNPAPFTQREEDFLLPGKSRKNGIQSWTPTPQDERSPSD